VREPMVHCKCGKGSCPDCSVACEKCNQRGHSQDTVSQPMRVGFVVRFTCPEHDHAAMQERVKIRRAAMKPTARAKKALAKANKKRLAQLVPGAGSHLQTHVRQSELVDEAGLGGAAASSDVRTAGEVAAALLDDGASRPASRALGAFAADSARHGASGSSQPPPGPLGEVPVSASRRNALAVLENGLGKRARYSATTRVGMHRAARAVGLNVPGGAGEGEILGSSSPFFDLTGPQLRRAAVRYLQIPDGPAASKAKVALYEFVGPTLMYVGASVTSQQFTTTEVCDALMGCADRAKLEVPSVRATLRQFIFELRHGDEGLQRFLDPPATGREDAVEESPSDSEK